MNRWQFFLLIRALAKRKTSKGKYYYSACRLRGSFSKSWE
jgi:hypothetical protein